MHVYSMYAIGVLNLKGLIYTISFFTIYYFYVSHVLRVD